MQKPFILKYNGRPTQVELRRVTYPPITRLKETVAIPGFGNAPVREGTGKFNKSQVTLWTSSAIISVDANKDAVHDRIRRLRQQESQLLDEIDTQIKLLRERREAILKLAWQKANIVTVKELVEQVDAVS